MNLDDMSVTELVELRQDLQDSLDEVATEIECRLMMGADEGKVDKEDR